MVAPFKKSKALTFSDSQIWKKICFEDAPICSLVLFKYYGDKCGARGSRFGHIFGRSRNPPKSIAIDQESWTSHLGIIKSPPKTILILKNREQTTFQLFVCCILGPIRPCFGLYRGSKCTGSIWCRSGNRNGLVWVGGIPSFENEEHNSIVSVPSIEWWPLMVGRPGGGQTLGHSYGKYY